MVAGVAGRVGVPALSLVPVERMIGPEHVVVQHQPMVVLIVLGLPQRHRHVHLVHAQVSVEVKMFGFF